MRSHTGGVLSFGTGGLLGKSTRQKLNTKSSTEAVLVGASEYLPYTMWVKFFMEAQGHAISECKFEQDNESAIKLETNGRTSAGPRSRHINIRYFWIRDVTEANDINISHCPTLQMLADFFTKPLQGSLFRKFRDVLLGVKHTSILTDHSMFPTEERVGNNHSETPMVGTPIVESGITVPEKERTGNCTSDDGFTVVLGKKKEVRTEVRTGHKKAIGNTNGIKVPHAPNVVEKIRITNRNRRSFSNVINSKRSAKLNEKLHW
jgi:hypothetical protein